MNQRNRILYFLVKVGKISYNEAELSLLNGEVSINDVICYQNQILNTYDKVTWKGNLIQNPDRFKYYKYYKPKGIECTLNTKIIGNLAENLNGELKELFYVGRLDKNSEGLLLLTNDGNIYNKIINPEKKLEKEYDVILESDMSEDFVIRMESGIEILGKLTKPCKIFPKGSNSFTIILTEGLNRQIRRMCFSLHNYVVYLKRTRIGEINLNHLKPGEFEGLNAKEIEYLRKLS